MNNPKRKSFPKSDRFWNAGGQQRYQRMQMEPMLKQLMREGKQIVEIVTQVTLVLALLPALGYGLWLVAGRPDESRQSYKGKE